MPAKSRTRTRKPNRQGGKTIHVATCLKPHELAWIEQQASREGLKVSAFLRQSALLRVPGYDPTREPSEPLKGQKALPGMGVPDVE